MAKQSFQVQSTVAAVPETVEKPTRQGRLLFCRLISYLVKAGIPLTKAVELSGQDSTDPAIRTGSEVIFDALFLSGRTLPEAIRRCPNMFEDLQVGLIRGGWETGRLHVVFARLADVDEMVDRMHKRMLAALVQPTLILIGVLLFVVLAPKFFVPHIRQMLAELSIPMPAFSKTIFAISDVVGSIWFWALAGLMTGVVYYRWETLFRKEPLQRALYKLCYRIPGLAVLLRSVMHAHFARVISMQLEAGTRLLDAMQQIQHGLTDPVFCQACKDVAQGIKSGDSVAGAMRSCGYFDRTMVAMVHVGEEAGNTAEMLSFIANIYEEELFTRIDTWEKLAAPALMLFSGVMVCIWVIAIILPLSSVIGDVL